MLRKNFEGRKNTRRQSANKRKEKRLSRSPKAQLAVLDKRLGRNKGAEKERLRLKNEIKNGGHS